MSKKEGTIIPEKIHLSSIKVFKSNLETSEDFLEDPQVVEDFEFGMNHELGHDFEEGYARFRLYFNLIAKDKEEQDIGLKAEYGIELHFKVDNFNDFVRNTEKGEVRIDAALGATLMGIAYSTSRGIILERMQGTFFDSVILPIIDPYKALMHELD